MYGKFDRNHFVKNILMTITKSVPFNWRFENKSFMPCWKKNIYNIFTMYLRQKFSLYIDCVHIMCNIESLNNMTHIFKNISEIWFLYFKLYVWIFFPDKLLLLYVNFFIIRKYFTLFYSLFRPFIFCYVS